MPHSAMVYVPAWFPERIWKCVPASTVLGKDADGTVNVVLEVIVAVTEGPISQLSARWGFAASVRIPTCRRLLTSRSPARYSRKLSWNPKAMPVKTPSAT